MPLIHLWVLSVAVVSWTFQRDPLKMVSGRWIETHYVFSCLSMVVKILDETWRRWLSLWFRRVHGTRDEVSWNSIRRWKIFVKSRTLSLALNRTANRFLNCMYGYSSVAFCYVNFCNFSAFFNVIREVSCRCVYGVQYLQRNYSWVLAVVQTE